MSKIKETKERIDLLTKTKIDKEIDKIFAKSELDEVIKADIRLQLEGIYRDKIEAYKKDYHLYQQSGRFFATTRIRRIRRGDFVGMMNLETDNIIIEKVQINDGVNIHTKSFSYPIALTRTFALSLNPIRAPLQRKVIIHMCIANTMSIDIAKNVKDLSDSVFLRNILQFDREKKVMERPLFQIIIGSAIWGIVFYFAMIQIFKDAIINILGSLELIPPPP